MSDEHGVRLVAIEYNPQYPDLGPHTSTLEQRQALQAQLAKLERALALQRDPRKEQFLREQIDELRRQLLR